MTASPVWRKRAADFTKHQAPIIQRDSNGVNNMTPYFWKNLISFIRDQRVIPIIGPELLVVQDQGQEKTFQSYIAERVAAELGIPPENLSNEAPLNDLVCEFRKKKEGSREDIYPLIKEIASDTKLSIPEPLRKLARIRHFNLFVTTNFDSLLERALGDERPEKKTESLTYSPSERDDLPGDLKSLSAPIVYHLLGRASTMPDRYVVTEEDALEFLHSLQDKAKRPEFLFDELKRNNLLIIGSNFPDWLARFFIRVAKGERLSAHTEQMVLADRQARTDNRLVVFLEHFTNRTIIFQPGGAAEFVDELYDRYMQANLTEPRPAPELVATSSEVSTPLIFLSYAHQDTAIVKNIVVTLKEIGWAVWFDKVDLGVGDHWDPKIMDNISDCLLFLPVVSAHTQQRQEGYFRREWNEAAKRSLGFDRRAKFLVPILIDEKIEEKRALVPKEFSDVQWHTLRGGEITESFKNEMRELLREHRMKEKHRS